MKKFQEIVKLLKPIYISEFIKIKLINNYHNNSLVTYFRIKKT